MKMNIAHIVFLAAIIVTFAACSWVKLNPETSSVIASISSRRVGVGIQSAYPDIAKKVYSACNSILETDKLTSESMDVLKDVIADVAIKDKLLRADISDLLSLIKIAPDIEITQSEIVLLRTIATGLKTGIDMGGKNE